MIKEYFFCKLTFIIGKTSNNGFSTCHPVVEDMAVSISHVFTMKTKITLFHNCCDIFYASYCTIFTLSSITLKFIFGQHSSESRIISKTSVVLIDVYKGSK